MALSDQISYLHKSGTGILMSPTDFRGAVGVLLTERGAPSIQLGFESVNPVPGQLLFVPEGVIAYAKADTGKDASLTLLSYPIAMLRENMELLDRELLEMFLLQARTCPVLLSEEDPVYGKVLDAVRTAETEYQSKETCYGLAMRAQVCRLTALFLRRYAQQSRVGDDRLLYHNVARFAEVLSYAEAHIDEKLTVPLLSARVHLSPDYFSHLLSDVTTKTATHYLRSVRVNAAMRLLLETDMTVSAVAAAVGIGAGDYLARLLRQCAGITPAQFRAMCRA